jgi:hypothetical protein
MEVKVLDFNGKILEERLNFLIQYSELNQIITVYLDVKQYLANQDKERTKLKKELK